MNFMLLCFSLYALIGSAVLARAFTNYRFNSTKHASNELYRFKYSHKLMMSKSLERHHTSSLVFYNTLRNCNDGYLKLHLNTALDALADALRMYGPEQLLSSYNGGKDADVIMHLLRAAVAKYSLDKNTIFMPKLVYFSVDDEFDEILEHLERTEQLFDLNIQRFNCEIVEGIKQHSQTNGGAIPAFVLGTRKGDPNCGNQETFSPSSNWMPVPFMRVNPILNWEYGHVWHFLRLFNLPYCPLYDRGYTSLGKKALTKPNPALLKVSSAADSSMEAEYWPAYMLSDWSLERAGRLPSSQRRSTETDTSSSYSSSDDKINETIVPPAQSAALVIVGDEILSGITSDVNVRTASRALSAIGIMLRKVVVVSDCVAEIEEEVRRLSQRFDIVITSGGIGLTHDDVTLRAVAQALDQQLVPNPEMMEFLESVVATENVLSEESQHNLSTDESVLQNRIEHNSTPKNDLVKLALLPQSTILLFSPPSTTAATEENVKQKRDWPTLQCRNVFVLPGVPQYFSAKMNTIAQHFLPKYRPMEVRKIVLSMEERNLVGVLNSLVAAHPTVKFGSYPYVEHSEFKTIVTVQGAREDSVNSAVGNLIEQLPVGAVLRVEKGGD